VVQPQNSRRTAPPLDIHGDRLTPGSRLSTSPDFSQHRTDLPPAPDSAKARSNGSYAGAEVRRTVRRRRPPPIGPEEYLHALPALLLLDRLSIPMFATGLDGVVVYNNPAFASMLGHHPDTVMLMGQQLPALLAGRTATPAHDCVTELRAAGNVVVDWLHVEGFPVHSVISETLFFRATDHILLLGITDITELIWATPPEAH
jgi:PAS domain-containing protein